MSDATFLCLMPMLILESPRTLIADVLTDIFTKIKLATFLLKLRFDSSYYLRTIE